MVLVWQIMDDAKFTKLSHYMVYSQNEHDNLDDWDVYMLLFHTFSFKFLFE